MKRVQNCFRMAFGDAEERTGGSFWMAMALLPVLQGAGTDANKRGELGLAEAEFLADCLGIGPLECGGARGLLFATQDGTAFLQAGGELLEEFVSHGNSVSMMDLRNLS